MTIRSTSRLMLYRQMTVLYLGNLRNPHYVEKNLDSLEQNLVARTLMTALLSIIMNQALKIESCTRRTASGISESNSILLGENLFNKLFDPITQCC